MSKTTTLGKSNDEWLGEDELLLAELLQNAHAMGLGHAIGAPFRTRRGLAMERYDPDADITSCCAVGAAKLDNGTHLKILNILNISGIADGNDTPGHDDILVGGISPSCRGVTLGAAFRQAMT